MLLRCKKTPFFCSLARLLSVPLRGEAAESVRVCVRVCVTDRGHMPRDKQC